MASFCHWSSYEDACKEIRIKEYNTYDSNNKVPHHVQCAHTHTINDQLLFMTGLVKLKILQFRHINFLTYSLIYHTKQVCIELKIHTEIQIVTISPQN